MNCEKCQDLLSDLLDGALSHDEQAELSAHLEECLDCFTVQRELDSIVGIACDRRGEYDAPPNEQALWLRIRNSIEIETGATAIVAGPVSVKGESWWARLSHRSWELSLPQLTAAVASIVIAVSLATAFSVRRYQNTPNSSSSAPEQTARTQSVRTPNSAMMDADYRVQQQEAMIQYWNQRVDQRRQHWNQQMRESFDRNLNVLDEVVAEARERLKQNPHDEVSEDVLNSALNDKMELLKEFSDL